MKIALLMSIFLVGCGNRYASDEANATARTITEAASDPNGSYVIHKPPGGCPAGWALSLKRFVESNGNTSDACIRAGSGNVGHIDVLMPGESTHL